MPVYYLDEQLVFPHPLLAEDGLLAIGGDLSIDRLLLAYQNGIFPWYNEGEPILWHAPDPRFVLFPEELKISKSMRKFLKESKWKTSLNQDFEGVIRNCSEQKRKNQDGTWITKEMQDAYIALHKAGFAHSVEVWNENGELIGGLYGVNLGSVFYGESMFHKASNASKVAFIKLLEGFPFKLIDCQVFTSHLASLGAREISLTDFLKIIEKESEKKEIVNRNTNFVWF
ncbi:MAG: leucyl/phenylalanyl-tRNA--protein transferase [Chitinophagales bacterium]|nr:leucyl/phenylalanyl-tRNA--protein transferase [Chitinophagales bacterium]